MNTPRTLSLSLVALSLSACAGFDGQSATPTRMEINPLGFHSAPLQADGLTEQVEALNAHARGIVRASTIKGAMMGAAIGCGLSVVSSGEAARCAGAAAVGAAGGALIGNQAGKRDVASRIKRVSPNGLVRNLRHANDSLEQVQADLPALLHVQEQEINRLTLALASNRIDQKSHDKGMDQIRQKRAELAQSLTMTAAEAKEAAANLREASDKGQQGLEWHIGATDRLARETLSARSTISLL